MRRFILLLMIIIPMVVFSENSAQRNAFIMKMNNDVIVKKEAINQSLAKLNSYSNDFQQFRTTYNAIDVPSARAVTNWFSKTAFVVKEIPLSLNARREKRMRLALKNKVLNDLYSKYFGETLAGVSKQYEDEVLLARENHEITLKQLNEEKVGYTRKLRELDQKREHERKQQIKPLDDKIEELMRSRKKNCQNKKRLEPCRLRHTGSGYVDNRCYNCKLYDSEIEKLEAEKSEINKIFTTQKWSDSRSDLVSDKSDTNAKYLALADVRTAQQAIYMVFREKVIGKFLSKIQEKIKSEQENVIKLTKEIQMLNTLIANPDLISENIVAKINKRDFDAALKGTYGVNIDGLTEEEHNRIQKEREELNAKRERESRERIKEMRDERRRRKESAERDRVMNKLMEHELRMKELELKKTKQEIEAANKVIDKAYQLELKRLESGK